MVRLAALVTVAFAVLLTGCSGASSSTPSPTAGAAPSPASAAAVQQVTFRIPTMVCSKNCWPVVRDTLQKQPSVTDVTLAPQKEEVPIDNPLVTVKLSGPFDADKAIEAIAAAGFAKATVEP